jgi:pilus assembly protein FimV
MRPLPARGFFSGASGAWLKIDKRKVLASAQKHMQKGALDKALKDYQTLLEADPKDVNLRLKVGDLYLRLNKNDEAVTAYLKVADRFMKDGFDAKAVALYKQITRIDSKRVDIYVPLAELYQRLGLTGDAMSALQTAADAHYRDGDKHAALELMRKMATLDPSNTTSRLKVAELLRQEGMRDEALAEYEAVAAELERQGEIEGRASVLQKVVDLDAIRYTAVEGLGKCLLALKKWSQAEEVAQRLIEAGSEHSVEGYEILAEACQGLRREDELPEIYRSMVAALRERGDENRAREIAQRFTSGAVSAEVSEAAVIEAADLDAAVGGSGMNFGEGPLDEAGFISDSGSGSMGDLDTSFAGTRTGGEREAGDGRRKNTSSTSTSSTPFNPPPLAPLGARDADTSDSDAQFLDDSEAVFAPADTSDAADVSDASDGADVSDASDASDGADVADSEQLLAEASVYLRYGKHERAIEGLRSILTREPKHRRALEKLGEACAAAGQGDQAIEAWRRAADFAAAEGDIEAIERIRRLAGEVDPTVVETLGAPPKAAKGGKAGKSAPEPDEDVLEIEIDELDAQELDSPDDSSEELSFDIDDPADSDAEESVDAELSFRGAEVETSSPDLGDAPDWSDASDGAVLDDDSDGVMVREAVDTTDSFATPPPKAKDKPKEKAAPEKVAAKAPEPVKAKAKAKAAPPAEEELEFEIDVDDSDADVLADSGSDAESVSDESDDEVEEATITGGSSTTPQEVTEGLEEAELYISQGMLEEADAVCRRLLEIAPGHPKVLLRLGEVEAARGAAKKKKKAAPPPPVEDEDTGEVKVQVAPPPAAAKAAKAEKAAPPPPPAKAKVEKLLVPDDGDDEPELEPAPPPAAHAPEPLAASAGPADSGDFDLAAELSDAFDERPAGGPSSGAGGTEEEGFQQVFAAFKAGVEKQLSAHDYEARFDLGIAYKEMGLFDDAIGEFRVALEAPGHKLQCLHMMSLCAIELGRAGDAVAHLEQALALPALPADQQMALRFDLGRAYAAQGDKTRARTAWEAVVAVDPDFCDVREHIADLDREPKADPGDSGESFESFDDLMSESMADGAAPAKGARGEKFESFEDFMGDDESSAADDDEDETQVAEISAAEAAEAAEPGPAEPPPAPAPAPAAAPTRTPPEPTPPKRKKKISFV